MPQRMGPGQERKVVGIRMVLARTPCIIVNALPRLLPHAAVDIISQILMISHATRLVWIITALKTTLNVTHVRTMVKLHTKTPAQSRNAGKTVNHTLLNMVVANAPANGVFRTMHIWPDVEPQQCSIAMVGIGWPMEPI